MQKDLEKILLNLRKLTPFLASNYQVSSLEIFGSFVRAEQKVQSDLDLLVSFSETPSLLKFIRLKNFLTEHLHIKVDLVMKDSLKPRLRENILNESIAV
jgi:predicted nucleotidyltransferase